MSNDFEKPIKNLEDGGINFNETLELEKQGMDFAEAAELQGLQRLSLKVKLSEREKERMDELTKKLFSLRKLKLDSNMERKLTVRDIKNNFYAKFGKGELTEKQRIFFEKLNKLGGRNIKEFPPEKVPDVDATVELSSTEAKELENEMNNL